MSNEIKNAIDTGLGGLCVTEGDVAALMRRVRADGPRQREKNASTAFNWRLTLAMAVVMLVLVAAAIFEPGMWTIILILGFVDWPGVCRLVRGNVLSLRETNFIKSDVTAGMSRGYILFREILPHTLSPVLVNATTVFAVSILDEAALSFLGQGVQSPTPSLGNLLGGAQSLTILTEKPWLWLPAGIVIILLVVCINFIGDALRDALDR